MVVHPLNGIPRFLRDDRLVGILNLDPILFRLADLLMVFVGHRTRLVLYHVTDVNLVAKNGTNGHIIPER